MKLHKIILALVSLMIIFDVLVNAAPKDPISTGLLIIPIKPPPLSPPPPPPPPPTKQPTKPPPPPPPSTTTTTTTSKQPPQPTSTSEPPAQPTSTSEPPVQPTSEPPPVPQPTYVPPVPQPTYVPPVQPPTNVPPVLQPTSPPPTTQSTEPIVTKAPISQHKGNLGDRCNNNDECLDGFICHENSCNKKNKNSSIKKAAIAGVIIIGASGGLGFIFFMYMKGSQLRKGHKQDYTPSMYSRDSRYSTDEMTNTNSFSNNSMTPRGIPITNHYDNLPPIGNRGFEGPRPGFYNYYNEGENIRQPPSTLQNYNRNHGGLAPARQFLPMNQGGLFPIRSIRGNYGDNDPLRDPNISENETMVISNESDPSIYSQDSSGSGTSLLKNRLIRENQRK